MPNPEYKVGQIWKYKNRVGEDESRLSIHKIDQLMIQGKNETVVYVEVDNIMSKKTGLGDVFTKDAIDKSVTELTDSTVAKLNPEAPDVILASIRKGRRQCCDTTVAEKVQDFEDSLRDYAWKVERVYTFIKDPYNPTLDELRWWAYDVDAVEPDQDYEGIIIKPQFLDVILEFAADPNCPKKKFFLRCLYMIVGGNVHWILKKGAGRNPDVERLLDNSRAIKDTEIQRWRALSEDLYVHPEKYDRYKWSWGLLAHED